MARSTVCASSPERYAQTCQSYGTVCSRMMSQSRDRLRRRCTTIIGCGLGLHAKLSLHVAMRA